MITPRRLFPPWWLHPLKSGRLRESSGVGLCSVDHVYIWGDPERDGGGVFEATGNVAG